MTIEELQKIEAEMDQMVVSQYGYTRGQLSDVFDAVRDPSDWRAPIVVTVKGEAVIPVTEAIRFFTATKPKVSLNVNTMTYLIESEGYGNGPAGDH